MDTTKVTVRVDYENNGEEWWDALRARPDGKRLERSIDGGDLPLRDLATLVGLPGWSDGPDYARHPLIVSREDLAAAEELRRSVNR